ncbi:MAG: peptidylprolyl isomerase [bacterium]|nr:peptidylprolyl isomerase [bacterium]
MTATTPQPMEGTDAPSQIEYLYERYKPLLRVLLILLIAAFAVYYFMKWQRQSAIDEHWTNFAVSIGMEGAYAEGGMQKSMTDLLADRELSGLEARLGDAGDAQAPYLLLAVARKAMIEGSWERAESALADLESRFPDHDLVRSTDFPLQIREVKEDENEDKNQPPRRNRKIEYEDPVAGSVVKRMRDQIAAAKAYETPKQFARIEPPADAKKVKIEFGGDYGSITIALMEAQAPETCKKFEALARSEFWKDLSVDEIQRDGSAVYAKRPMQFHIGYQTTKEPDRTKWTKTDESEHLVDFEDGGLSHFPGAVAARVGKDGMSAVDRIYICGEDASSQDDRRVVFGYVIEGLETVQQICEASMTAQEEESGTGVPTDNITVTAVTVIE